MLQISYAPQTLDIESQQEQSGNKLYNQARHATIQGIESTVSEVVTMYRQLAHMVMHQGEMVQRIDQNLEEMQSNVRKRTETTRAILSQPVITSMVHDQDLCIYYYVYNYILLVTQIEE